MNSQVIFKIDKTLKQRAMKRAKLEGVPFAFVLKMATQAYANHKMDVMVVAEPKFNYKTDKEIKVPRSRAPRYYCKELATFRSKAARY
jgi:hypothetical protein